MRYPYWLVLLLALDRLGAALFFNRADITISALCWVVRFAPIDRTAAAALTDIHPYPWQILVLRWIGNGLELINPGHCVHARASDTITAQSTVSLLQ